MARGCGCYVCPLQKPKQFDTRGTEETGPESKVNLTGTRDWLVSRHFSLSNHTDKNGEEIVGFFTDTDGYESCSFIFVAWTLLCLLDYLCFVLFSRGLESYILSSESGGCICGFDMFNLSIWEVDLLHYSGSRFFNEICIKEK